MTHYKNTPVRYGKDGRVLLGEEHVEGMHGMV